MVPTCPLHKPCAYLSAILSATDRKWLKTSESVIGIFPICTYVHQELYTVAKFQIHSYNAFRDMNYYPVTDRQADRRMDRQTDGQTDGQADRKWLKHKKTPRSHKKGLYIGQKLRVLWTYGTF